MSLLPIINVLINVTLQVNPGEFVAIVGASGAGKSTLIRTLLGHESPESGTILYDGCLITNIDMNEVRPQMGVYLNNSKLEYGDIFSNIVGLRSFTVEDAWKAASLAGIKEEISKFPMSMRTLVSGTGYGFSGGQQQRILIARALLGKPSLLFLDEPTSALDEETQKIINRTLARVSATRIVATHRLSTIRLAETIYVMDKGKIVEKGNFQTLYEEKGLFWKLMKDQVNLDLQEHREK